ncbi:MAG: GDP-mannose 4,6-dehydratase, partial [Caldilineaceae bacterium]
RGDPLTVYGDGSRTRSFGYVDDLVEGIVRLMAKDVEGPVNLGNPVELTILEFAELTRKVIGSSSDIAFVHPTDERTRDDPKQRCPDISKAKAALGWEPRVPVEEGLRKTADYFRVKLGLV